MRLPVKTTWLPLRAVSATVVLAVLIVELFVSRSWLMTAVQVLFIMVISVTSVLDGLRHRRHEAFRVRPWSPNGAM